MTTAPLAPRPAEPLALASERPGLLDGTRALFSGLGFIARTPAMWPLALVPVVVAGVVTTLVGGAVIALVTPHVAAAVGPHPVLAVLAKILAGVLALIVAALIGAGVAQPLSGPALNRIVARVEADMGAPPRPETGFFHDMARALGSMLVGYSFGLPLLALLSVISLLVPPAVVITFPLKLIVLALVFAWDFFDYPLSIHGMPLGQRIALVVRHARVMIGFGLGLALVSLIPCAAFFVMPIGVAGAARLARQIELFEQRAGGA